MPGLQRIYVLGPEQETPALDLEDAKPRPDEDGEEDPAELVEVHHDFARVAAWLSTPKGRPTPLAYTAYVVLVGVPVWLALIGIDPPMWPGGLASAANGDAAMAILQLGAGLGLLLAGPAALHDAD